MRKKAIFWLVAVAFVCGLALQANAQGKISGLAYMDYYNIRDHHTEDVKGMNGFWVRRIYFTYDHKLSSAFNFRFRLEGNSPGDFKSKTKIEPYIKDLYLEYKWNETSFLLGLSPTPTWDQVEKCWGYRSVEKTPVDLQRMGSPRDFGIAVKGHAADNIIHYHFMLANGEGTKGEVNKEKKLYAALGFSPVKEIYFEFYGDYSPGEKENPRISTFQVFFACKREKFRAGLQYIYQKRSGDNQDVNLQIASGFAVFYLTKKVNIFARMDRMFQPNPFGEKISYMPFDPTSPSIAFLSGIDFQAADYIHFIPNMAYVNYDDISPGDFYLKLTMYLSW